MTIEHEPQDSGSSERPSPSRSEKLTDGGDRQSDQIALHNSRSNMAERAAEKSEPVSETGIAGNGNDVAVEKAPKKAADVGHGGAAPSSEFTKIPDGGWGWFVVFSSFMIHVIADGIVYSFGIFLTELVDYFNAGRGEITWVGSLQPAITFTVGPLSSALTNRYGCRIVTIAGAIVAAAGFVLSMWAPNYYYLYLTSGVMAGIGFGLIYLPAIVCVAQYFEKKRSFATGLAVCGSGFGTFLLAPICKILIQEYGWRGSMLLLGGFCLNIVVCGIIFRPLESDGPPNDTSSVEVDKENEEEVHLLVGGKEGGDNSHLTAKEGLEIISSLQDLDKLPKGKAKLVHGELGEEGEGGSSVHQRLLSNGSTKGSGELGRQERALSETDARDMPVSGGDRAPKITISSSNGKPNSNSNIAFLSASQSLSPKTETDIDPALLAKSDGALHHNAVMKAKAKAINGKHSGSKSDSKHASKTHLAPLQRKDVFYTGSLMNIPLYRSQPDIYHRQVAAGSKSSGVDHHGERRDSAKRIRDQEYGSSSETSQTGCMAIWSEFQSTLKDMMSLSLLKNPVFLMFGISNFLTSIGFNMPFIFLPDRAEVAGIDKQRAALLLSVIGIANTVGRAVFGFLSDRSWVNRLMLYNSALTICGIATALSPGVGGNYNMLVAYAAVFGLFIGVYVSLTSVVLVDLLGLELLTNSFGLLLLFQGVATFIGPPIAGWLFDWTGSYDISFIVMGTLIALSGAMLFFLPFIQRRYERRTAQEDLKHDADLGRHILQNNKEVNIGLVEVEA